MINREYIARNKTTFNVGNKYSDFGSPTMDPWKRYETNNKKHYGGDNKSMESILKNSNYNDIVPKTINKRKFTADKSNKSIALTDVFAVGTSNNNNWRTKDYVQKNYIKDYGFLW